MSGNTKACRLFLGGRLAFDAFFGMKIATIGNKLGLIGGIFMESITVKLANIERTAHSIVDSAETKKQELDGEMQKRRDQFDADLEARTSEKLDKIKVSIQNEIEEKCQQEELENERQIAALKKEFEKKHSVYAKEIVNRMIEG